MRDIILLTINATRITKISAEVLEYSGARGLNEISLETCVAVDVVARVST